MKRFVDGNEVELEVTGVPITPLHDRLSVRSLDGTHTAVAVREGDTVHVSYRGRVYEVTKATRTSKSRHAASGEIRAPMPGAIVDVLVTVGQGVAKGDRLLVLEAMKTQQPFVAPFDGTVTALGAKVGEQVVDGAVLVVVTPAES